MKKKKKTMVVIIPQVQGEGKKHLNKHKIINKGNKAQRGKNTNNYQQR